MKSLLFLLAGLACSTQAMADQVVFEYSSIYSGDGMPAGTTPYARATFTSNTPGTVTLLLEAFLAPAEFVSRFFFNFDPSLNLGQLSVAHSSGTSPALNGMHLGPANSYKAGGGGLYDILVEFPTSNTGTSPRFNGVDTSTFVFTSTQAIAAASFNFLSAPHGGYGPFSSAAHFQGLGANANRSAWVSGEEPGGSLSLVPLPTAAWAGVASLAGLAGLGVVRRRSHRN